MTESGKTNKTNMTERVFTESALYNEVLVACETALLNSGQFHKREIMKGCHNEAFTEVIRWDWVVKKIEAGHRMPGGEVHLIPVAESFFKAKSSKEKAAMLLDESDPAYTKDSSFPGKFVAQGYGKRTAGWVLGTFAGGRFALYKVKVSLNQVKGRADNARKLGRSVAKQLIAAGTPDKAAEIMRTAGLKPPLAIKQRS